MLTTVFEQSLGYRSVRSYRQDDPVHNPSTLRQFESRLPVFMVVFDKLVFLLTQIREP